MKLDYIEINNFRQFYGKNRIDFSSGSKKITVLHANNGSGKTALLNAFTWALFDTTTLGFQLPDQLVNKRAIRETEIGKTIVASIEIRFSHNGKNYVVTRTQETIRTTEEPGWQNCAENKPKLLWESKDGQWKSEEKALESIARVLPKDLHNYFFFDGERIERIVQPNPKQRKEIENAAKKLLDLQIIERGINHLNKVRKKFEEELKGCGDDEFKILIEKKQEKESKIETENAKIFKFDQEIDNQNDLIDEYDRKLAGHEETKKIQERRVELGNSQEELSKNKDKLTKEMRILISKKGYSVFIPDLINSFKEQIELMRKKGELPAGIKKQFIDDLLEHKHQCICGEELIEGTEKYNNVLQWRKQAGLADVEEKALSMGGEVKYYEEVIEEFPKEILSLKRKISEEIEKLSNIQIELDEIREQLKNSPTEEISKLQIRRDDSEEEIKLLNQKKGGCIRVLSELKESITKLDEEIAEKEASQEREQLIQKRIKVVKKVIRIMEKMLNLYDRSFRFDLEKKMNSLFKKMTLTPYIPTISDDYAISLQESAGGTPLDVAASQGENQILSLSFIGSIIEVVRDNHKNQSPLPTADADSYPVVMDSPFGALDHIYRKQIATELPQIADQIVVLVTKTQWRGEVEQAMAGNVGKEFVLTYYSPRQDIEEDYIEINSNKYSLVKKSNDEFEYTLVKEVIHG